MINYTAAILGIIALVTSPSALPADWIPLGTVNGQQLELDVDSLDHVSPAVEPRSVFVIGGFRFVGASEHQTHLFWTSPTSCEAQQGRLASKLIPNGKTQAYQWNGRGNSVPDVVGTTLCMYHEEVVKRVNQELERTNKSKYNRIDA